MGHANDVLHLIDVSGILYKKAPRFFTDRGPGQTLTSKLASPSDAVAMFWSLVAPAIRIVEIFW